MAVVSVHCVSVCHTVLYATCHMCTCLTDLIGVLMCVTIIQSVIFSSDWSVNKREEMRGEARKKGKERLHSVAFLKLSAICASP